LEPGATADECRVVTDFLRQVRRYTESRGVPLGLRIPANLGYLRSRGLDVPAIVREGLVDFIGFSNFWQTSWDLPYEQLRAELGDAVLFYGVVENAPNWIAARTPADMPPPLAGRAPYPNAGVRYMAASPRMVRANAAGKLAMGVHGIEQFNFFCTDQPKVPGLRADYGVLRGIHDLESLRGKEKHYCLSSPSGRLSMLWEIPEQIPAVLEPKHRREFRLTMAREPAGRKLRVQAVVEKSPSPARLAMSFNGAWPVFAVRETADMLFPVGPYTRFADGLTAWEYTLDAVAIREGWNTVTVTNYGAASVKVESVELGVS
ncbi:MAG: hypothetical protein JNL62_12260, partial [Bryobacterales bacterium]|nr:hypothetical protein [Bryobacterales bacterium]